MCIRDRLGQLRHEARIGIGGIAAQTVVHALQHSDDRDRLIDILSSKEKDQAVLAEAVGIMEASGLSLIHIWNARALCLLFLLTRRRRLLSSGHSPHSIADGGSPPSSPVGTPPFPVSYTHLMQKLYHILHI